MTKIYDTSSLLLIGNKLFETNDNIAITSIVLQELERIKTSASKDSSTKYSARQVLDILNQNQDKFACLFYSPIMFEQGLEENNDNKILSTIRWYEKQKAIEDFIFVTNDLSMKLLAELIFEFKTESVTIPKDDYCGYLDIVMTEEEMAEFYTSYNNENIKAKINQYVNIYNTDNQRVDTVCWTGTKFRPLKYKSFTSTHLGEVKPLKNDIYQAIAADSLMHNKLTMIKGPAGSGKSWLSLGYLFYQLEKGQINKIIIFCNTVAVKNAARLGFYPGDKDSKLLDSQIGNFLSSKLGEKIEVERLIDEGVLILLPMSDIRGYDTSGMRAGIYIPEAQNLDVELLKLAIQRVGEDSFIILDGDIASQVDLIEYEGANNGMRRASQIFRGSDLYGEITLQKIHRSKLAELAEKM